MSGPSRSVDVLERAIPARTSTGRGVAKANHERNAAGGHNRPERPGPTPRRRWVVIPACNEEYRLESTLRAYLGVLGERDVIVVMVNGSTDSTPDLAGRIAASDGRVRVIVEPEKIGKGGAVIRGFRHVLRGAHADDPVAYVDADGALEPRDLIAMLRDVRRQEIAVGSRWLNPRLQTARQSPLRRLASRCFNRLVRRVLLLPLSDTQCAAKVTRARHLRTLCEGITTTGFAFDVDLLLVARSKGLHLREVPVRWSDQAGSTVRLHRAAPAMFREVLRLRRAHASQFSGNAPRLPRSTSFVRVSAPDVYEPPPARTAGPAPSFMRPATPPLPDPVLSHGQMIACTIALIAVAASFLMAPVTSLVALNTILIVFFAMANVFKLLLIRAAGHQHSTIRIEPGELASMGNADLPVYTILVPVYREAAVLQQLLTGIERLDYPTDRLDVKILIENDDAETAEALAGLVLPEHFSVLRVPDVGPKSKPRACNHGLLSARGEFLVIYDAEDLPDPDQLRKAVLAFRQVDSRVVCLQAKLNYFNRTQNLLTRWFTAEYSTWFDQLLPGLQAMDLAIPLGGTSNHLRTQALLDLGGWNAYNVTEDADLGMRIHLRHWKTAIIDSTTLEEATSRVPNWIRQRSRWVKGYMQTYLVHMRHPVRLQRAMGLRAFVAFHLFFGAGTLCLIVNPIYWVLTVVWFLSHAGIIETAFPPLVLDIGTAGLFLGNAAFALTAVSGCLTRRNYDDVKWAFLAPLYWLLMSVAAFKAVWQLVRRPYYWEKTTHGHCLIEPTSASPVADGGRSHDVGAVHPNDTAADQRARAAA